MTGARNTADNPKSGIAFRIASTIFFAGMAAFAKLAANSGVPFIEVVFFRNFFALLPVLGYVALLGGFAVLKTNRPRAHLARATIGGTGMMFVFMGIIHLPLNEATAIGFSVPLVATLMSAVLLKEQVGRHRWLAIAMGFIGVLILVHPDPGKMVTAGAIYALIGVCFTSAVNVTVRQIAATEPAVTITFYFMLLASIVLLLFLPFFWITPTPEQWMYLLGIGITGGFAQIMMSQALRHAPVSTLVPFDYTQILWAGLLAWMLWDELPGHDTLVGAAIIIGSGLYIIYRERKRAVAPQRVASAVEEG